jgi:regulator of replication initiation timing
MIKTSKHDLAMEVLAERWNCDDLRDKAKSIVAENARLAEENERLREALRKLINAAELEGFTEERSDDPLSIAKAALAGREGEK